MQRRAPIRWLLAVTLLIILDAALVMGYDRAAARYVRQSLPGVKFDAVVLFFADDGQLGHRTQTLLEAGAALLASGAAGQLICVGGNRPASGYRGCEEVKTRLAALGVPAARIVVDRESRDTIGNMRAAARIARERRVRSAILLSLAWHAPRVRIVAALEWPEGRTYSIAPSLEKWGRALYWRELWQSAHHELVSWLIWRVFGEEALGALVRVLRP